MATRTDIIQAIRARKRFRAGAMEGRTSEKGDYRVWSYDVVLLHVDPDGNIVKKDLDTKHSTTTSKHQGIVRQAVEHGEIAKGPSGEKGKGDYYVAKYFENGDPPRIVKRNLSREEAQAIVRKPGTSGGTTPNRWFLGFDKAHPKRED